MNPTKNLTGCDTNRHLISMTTPDRLIQLGLNLGFCEDTGILDLCCGYGEMLKLWNDVFGIRGTGVDICPAFIEHGRQRRQNPERVKLLCADALHYADDEKYDVVCCTEFFGDIKDIAGTIAFLEKYAKPNGKLIFGRMYSKPSIRRSPLPTLTVKSKRLPPSMKKSARATII